MLRDDEPKEGSGYARYGWRKGCFMLCVELATTMNSVTSLRSYQETHLSVTDFNDILGRDFAHLVHPFDGYAIGTQVSVC